MVRGVGMDVNSKLGAPKSAARPHPPSVRDEVVCWAPVGLSRACARREPSSLARPHD